MSTNPKLAGSNIVDVIPQTGECPIKCAECFYNGGRFFRKLDTPLVVTPEEARGKIVRVNSGHDSNLQRDIVLAATADFEHKFYNTSIPKFDFPGPVVFTCNAHKLKLVENPPPNLMFVRFRVHTGNLYEAESVVKHYLVRHGIPVVMTFMRYYSDEAVPDKDAYEYRKSILNSYWMLRREYVLAIMSRWGNMDPPVRGVRMCSTPYSSYCGDCRNCEFLYWDCLRRMGYTVEEPSNALSPDELTLLGFLRENGKMTVKEITACSYTRTENDVLRPLNELKRGKYARSFEAPDKNGKMVTYWEAINY